MRMADPKERQAIRRFKRVMNVKIKAHQLSAELNELSRGVNWNGCTKAHMAEAVALGVDCGVVIPDGFTERLEKKYGVMEKRRW